MREYGWGTARSAIRWPASARRQSSASLASARDGLTFGTARAAEIGLGLLAAGYIGFAFGHGNALIVVCIVLTTMDLLPDLRS
jgi:hypothetical protein